MKATVKPASKPAAVKKPAPFFLALESAGLIGCISGPGDLAKNHSQYLKGKPRGAVKVSS